jgi:3alpha(or 20beta)-hydroxysteroid dehydrogenase
MAGRLEGKVALISGAARGIGAATAQRFAREGARVMLADRRHELGEKLAASLEAERPGSARYAPLDVTSEPEWTAAVERTRSAFGGIDVLVNAAGIIRVTPLAQTDLELFRKILDVNLVGTFLGMRAVLGPMQARGGGSIVNFSSPQGLEGRFGVPAYTASKFAVRGLTKTAAIELGPLGIRVNAVVPGPTRTAMTERPGWSEADYAEAYGLYPLGRMASPEEIAAACLFLASDEASYCTGTDLVVDGGVTAGKPRERQQVP